MNMVPRAAATPMDEAPPRPASGAAPFELDEIFFSRTDARGIIKAFNAVFVRIADFAPDELLNAPHRIIRHDDMPRGAFWLMWKGIQSGAPMGMYVKNRSRDGLYYWVFALVTPVEGGYLSVRIKPSSPLLDTVATEYADLSRREKDEKLTPEESAKLLLDRIAELGFPSYYSFQAKALCSEYEARRAKLGLPVDTQVAGVDAVMDAAQQISREEVDLNRKFATAELLTANMRINAARLTTGRGTINEIAKGYDLMLQDIRRHMRALCITRTKDGMLGATKDARSLFLLCAERVMSAARENFLEERQEFVGVSQADELDLLSRMCAQYRAESNTALQDAIKGAARVRRDADFLRRLVVGLSTIRITCRVESGMLQGDAQGLETIVRRLDDFHDEIAINLERIENAADTMTRRAGDHPRL